MKIYNHAQMALFKVSSNLALLKDLFIYHKMLSTES